MSTLNVSSGLSWGPDTKTRELNTSPHHSVLPEDAR